MLSHRTSINLWKKKRQFRYRLLSLALCVALLVGSAGPMQVRAALDPDSDDDMVDGSDPVDFGDEGNDDNNDDEGSEAAGESSASTAAASQSSGNAAVDEMRQEIDQINKKIDDLEKQNEELKNRIYDTKSVREQEIAKRDALNEEIYITSSQIELLLERIVLLETEIDLKQSEIEAKQEEHDENYELFLRRMRAMFMYDDSTTLGLIFGADDFVDFLTRTEMVARIAEHDQKLMQTLVDEKLELERNQAELEEAKLSVERDRDESESKKADLSVKVSAVSESIQDLNALEAAFQADLESNKALAAQMEADIVSLMEKIKWSTNPYAGGSMAYPLPGYSSITSRYGPRFGGSDYHTGVDISGTNVHGAPIVAANDGTVVVANWSYTPGRGYGIFVMLDHGGGVSTLYGHCSNIVVSVGEEVKKGQKIAEVGNTGWSTGPHLHFEVRINNAHTDPAPYIGI